MRRKPTKTSTQRTRGQTCLVCSREFTTTAKAGKRKFCGTCPYCGTYDNGSANSRLATSAEIQLCEQDGHEWKRTDQSKDGNRYVCQRCGDWMLLKRTRSDSIDCLWTKNDGR